MNKAKPIIVRLNPKQELPIIGIKIIDERFALDFVKKGIIHFSNPETWKNPALCSGKQLDKDEGCFCFSVDKNDEQFIKMGRKFKKEHSDGGWKYYEKTDLIVGTCFYGVKKDNFKDGTTQYGKKNVPSKNASISNDYFKDFLISDEDKKRKKTVIIFDFYKFIDLLLEKIMEMGVSKEDVSASSVYYVKKAIPFCTPEAFPFEFFLKDYSFSDQAEFRIIIASKNKKFYQLLRENNNNISIGDISSFTDIQDYYNFELDLSIQGKKLLYSMATPIQLTLDQRSFKEIVMELYQILQNHLPGPPKEKSELDTLAKPNIEHLLCKYGVEFNNWRLYNVPFDEYQTLPDIYKGLCETIVK